MIKLDKNELKYNLTIKILKNFRTQSKKSYILCSNSFVFVPVSVSLALRWAIVSVSLKLALILNIQCYLSLVFRLPNANANPDSRNGNENERITVIKFDYYYLLDDEFDNVLFCVYRNIGFVICLKNGIKQ